MRDMLDMAISGRLGRDPEPKNSRNGNPFATLSLAVDTGQDEDGKALTTWVRVTCFGNAAERISGAAKKGDRVYCEGAGHLDHWRDGQSGEQRAQLQLKAWKVEVLGRIGRNRPQREEAVA